MNTQETKKREVEHQNSQGMPEAKERGSGQEGLRAEKQEGEDKGEEKGEGKPERVGVGVGE